VTEPARREAQTGRDLPVPRWVERVRASAASIGSVRLVCIDGPAGSGKTTLATTLADAVRVAVGDCVVVHGDDLYEGWPVVAAAADRVVAFGMLADRVQQWLFEPWQRGEPGAHPTWDWDADRWADSTLVPPAPVVVLEGVGLASRTLREQSVLSLWVEADLEVGLARVLARDGADMRDEMIRWQDDERAWFTLDGTRAGVDERLVTDV
jgi:uridine kinase